MLTAGSDGFASGHARIISSCDMHVMSAASPGFHVAALQQHSGYALLSSPLSMFVGCHLPLVLHVLHIMNAPSSSSFE